MATQFFDAWNATLPAFEAMFGEEWIFKGTAYPAIAIDVQTSQTRAMKGGSFEEVNTTVYVRNDVFASSGVSQDQTITIRGDDFSILEVHKEGDECLTLICGPVQVDVWGR